MNIGDVFLRLLADSSGFTPQVQREAQKAGDAGAKTLGQRLGAALKDTGFKLFGAAASAAFAVAARGAAKLEEIQARLQAETGASADEARAAAKAINAAAGSERLSLDEVADAATRVRRDMGLSGTAADDLTARFAKFAHVTKQNAGDAVSAFDDILDAWNLTAADSQSIMDKLIVSGQKYGGTIADDERALVAMAPALKALNLGFDDSISLIDLFKTTGLDAEGMVRALNSAVKNLKPGETLDDLIQRISSIEDPTKRAQEAIKVFGARGGVAMANALRPGVDSLKDFALSQDDVRDATTKAADAIDATPVERIRKFFSEAAAAARGFGFELGSAFTALASIGSLFVGAGGGKLLRVVGGGIATFGKKLVERLMFEIELALDSSKAVSRISDAVSGALDKVTKSSIVKSGGQKVGQFLGSTVGLAFKLALLAAAIPIILELWKQYQDIVDANKTKLNDIGKSVAEEITRGNIDELKKSEAALNAALDALHPRGRGIDVPGSTADDLRKQRDLVHAAIVGLEAAAPKMQAAAAQVSAAAARGLMTSGPTSFATAARTLARELPLRLLEAGAATREAAASLPSAIAAGIRQRRDDAKNAMDNLVELLKHPMSRAREIGRLLGYATSKALVKGLRSSDPEIRNSAQAAQKVWLAELGELAGQGVTPGKKALARLNRDLKSDNPAIRAAAQAVKKVLDTALSLQPAKTPGDQIGLDLAGDLKDKGPIVGKAAYDLGVSIARNIRAGVHGSGQVVPHTPATHSGGFTDKGGKNFASGTSYVPFDMTARIHRGEMIIPRVNADAIRAGSAVLSGSTGGVTIENLSIDARGSTNPAATGVAVRNGVADAMAQVFRDQTARLPRSGR